jgi:hypothetical protein
MPVQAEFNLRSGGNKFLLLAQTLCRLVNISAPVIQLKYADRPALLAVLEAAQSMCALLPAAQSEAAEADALSVDAFDPADETPLPGQFS